MRFSRGHGGVATACHGQLQCMASLSLAHPAREAVFVWMGLKTRFMVPAFDEILNKITQDRTGLGRRVPLLREAASKRLSLRGCLSARLSLRGCLCEAASARLLLLEAASPGGSVLGRNTVRKEPEYLVLGSPESSTTSTELASSDSPYEDLEPGPGDISVFALLG